MSTVAIIQCRYGSRRFPGKALAPLNGVPIVEHVVTRARQARWVGPIVLAMPSGEANEPLVQWAEAHCQRLGFAVYQDLEAEENDVLSRFQHVAEWSGADVIVRLTADCPRVEPRLIDRLVATYYRSGPTVQYAWIDTRTEWADGLDVEVFSRRALMALRPETLSAEDREHVTPALRRLGDVWSLPFDPAYAGWPKCSIDTPEDLARVQEWRSWQSRPALI